MGSPEKQLRFIHIAGTNGKGSVAAMLSHVLTAAGYRTGLYTSPYIMNFNERMQVDGGPLSDETLVKIVEHISPLALSMEDVPTEFELVTALAMEFFLREGCDVVVLETGLGGRLDSTNVVENPLISIITNIGLDHTRELGDTPEKIAAEKAGIIKKGCPTLIYDLPAEVRAVIEKRCLEMESSLKSADFSKLVLISESVCGQIFSYGGEKELFLPLLGTHQLKNAAVVLEAIEILRSNDFEISKNALHSGFEATRWPARFEIVSEKPYFVVDGGHNPQCAEVVAENLQRYFPYKRVIVLIGVLADKDYMGMARALNTVANCFVTITPPVPRALPAEKLSESLAIFSKAVYPCDTIELGIEKALSQAGEDSVICAVGSLYSAGTVRAFFGK